MTLVSAGILQGVFEGGDRPTSADFKNLLDSFEHSISAAATSDKVDRLGAGAVGKNVFAAGTTASAQNVMGAGAVGRELFGAAATASAQGHLGAGAVGIEVLQAGTTASAQSHLGGGTVGVRILEAQTTASAASITGGANAATTAQVANPAVTASAAYVSPDKMRYSPWGVRAYVNFTCAAEVQQSQRVSSVTREAEGRFKIKWTPALPTADYAWVAAGGAAGNEIALIFSADTSSQPTISALNLIADSPSDILNDPNNAASVAVFCSGV